LCLRWVGSALENAISVRFMVSSKWELLIRAPLPQPGAARMALFDYIKEFYNRVGRPPSLGNLSPHEYERKVTVRTRKGLNVGT
jgi:transposase InsO family protein